MQAEMPRCPNPCDCERFPRQDIVRNEKTGQLEVKQNGQIGVKCKLLEEDHEARPIARR